MIVAKTRVLLSLVLLLAISTIAVPVKLARAAEPQPAVVAKASRQFDFGGSLAVEEGYVAVTSGTRFSAERGYGWINEPELLVRDQGKPDALRRDFVMGTKPATFRIAGLDPGLYLLKIVSGDMASADHATRVKVAGDATDLPVMTQGVAQFTTLRFTVTATNTLDITFDSPRGSWMVNALSLTKSESAIAPELSRVTMPREGNETKSHTLVFDTQAPGAKLHLTHWGLDTAWAVPDHIRRGMLYMGPDQVDVIRVSFPVNEPLVNGELPAYKKEHFETRLAIAKLAGDKLFSMLPDTEGGVHPWFKNGREVIPERWVELMATAQRYYGKKMESLEPFNEADWGWGQGTIQNLNDILAAMQKSPEFEGVQLGGPSTLSSDAAEAWYLPIKNHLQRGTTHSLGGSFFSFINFYINVLANGQVADHPEVHNLVEVIAGAEYGVERAIWWGTAERARGDFVKAVQGERLAYAEDRPRWSAAGVYRTPDGKLQAFMGSSERNGQATDYRFVSRDRDVFFNGIGPQRDFAMPIRRDTEDLINITWGQDVPPAIGGKYVIVNRQNGKVLSVAGDDKHNRAGIQQMDYNGATSQQWEIAPLYYRYGDQSYFTLRAVHSGRVLSIPKESYEDGAKLLQQGDGDKPSQHWFFDYAGDNCFYIRNRWSAQYVEASNDNTADIHQISRTGSPQQQWRLVPAGVQSIDLDPPKSPTGVSASGKPLAVELKWDANHEPDIAGYTVFRATNAAGPYDTIARGVSTHSYVDGMVSQQKYFYVIKAVDQSLNSSTFSAEVSASPTGGNAQLADYLFDGNADDSSGNGNHADAHGSSTYGVGLNGKQSVLLDGEHDFVRLPPHIANSADLSIAGWVYLEAGVQWQRIFDFGNDETQFFFLTPNSNQGTLRLAAKNGGDELRLDAPGLPENQWVHVAVTLGGKTAMLYVNGRQFARSDSWSIKPADFKPVFNYIGRSQFEADPLLRGRVCDFQIFNYPLDSDQVKELAMREPASKNENP